MAYKMMIIDDDEMTLDIIQALLEDEYTIIKMTSGLDALSKLKFYPDVDIILLDMMMPGLDGMKVLKALKADKRLSRIPVILLTSLDGINFEAEGYISGASDFIRKPIHAELLKLKIQRQIYLARIKKEHAVYKQRLTLIKKLLENVELDITGLDFLQDSKETEKKPPRSKTSKLPKTPKK